MKIQRIGNRWGFECWKLSFVMYPRGATLTWSSKLWVIKLPRFLWKDYE